ncbi:MAG: S8 family serine peptidase [Candidatus Thorarchaeota archaeon]|jgi:subtilisin family serine protease
MDGLSNMAMTNPRFRQRFLAIVVLAILLLPTPVIVFSSGAQSTHFDEPVISAALAALMSQVAPEDVVPIVVKFPDEYTSEQMLELITAADLSDVSIRHVFTRIPVVSLYSSVSGIYSMMDISQIEILTLDRQHTIQLSSEEFGVAQISGNQGYIHGDEILGASDMWAQGYDGSGVTVAVIDSGAMGTHPDIEDRLIGFYDFIGGNHDMDPTGGIDAYDDNGHGTATAWLVAGSGEENGGIYKGMAPGADLLIIKVLDSSGAGDDTVIAQGIEYAVETGVDVISLSIGSDWSEGEFVFEPSVLQILDAIASGVTVVISAGNSGPAAQSINSPATVEEAITVGASSGAAGVVGFSSTGPVLRTVSDPVGYYAKPDLVAPGFQVLSGRYDGNPFEYPSYNASQYGDAYTLWSGTSASAPQVAGLVALLKDKYVGLTPIEAKTFLMAGATDLNVDPMAQGYGLPNVTRSSELINESSRLMTIMTPLRFPTLPGSSNVFVFGDDREGQNVTIISTVPMGTADIIGTGNASTFIATRDQVTVQAGHTHFGIALEIPEELPLSAIGRYTGQIALVSDNDTIATMELDLTITTYGGKLLVDMGHHDSEDPDDPSFYRYFSEYLRQQGIVMSEYPTNWQEFLTTRPIDESTLSSTEVFMIMDTETAYFDSEIEALHQFVDDGGTLLMLSEGFWSERNAPAFALDSYNEILAPYGITCEEYWIGEGVSQNSGLFYGVDYNGAVEEHPLMDGVENLYILNGGTVHVDSSVAGAQGLFWVDDERTHAIVAAADSGDGHVIVISDGSTLYDDIVFDAIYGEADNLRLLRNVAVSITTDNPRIFDLQIETGTIGQIANLTTFVFDDNLDSVTIDITGPNGDEIDGTESDSLGYKFTTSFVLESGGFYHVNIEATDTSGNSKVLLRTFLIPVDVADDAFVANVIIILLGVVVAGIGYVAFLRFRVRERISSRSEREWEPQWDDGSEPPSIE